MLYSMSFLEFKPAKRINSLREIGFSVESLNEGHTLDIKLHGSDVFGSTHTEALKYLCDPIYNPKMYNMERGMCRIINNMHHEFWCWKNEQPFVDIEADIAEGIMGYLEDQECKEQDEWLALTPEDIRKRIIDGTHGVFNDDFWQGQTTPTHYVVRTLSSFEYTTISWKRVQSLMFNEVRK